MAWRRFAVPAVLASLASLVMAVSSPAHAQAKKPAAAKPAASAPAATNYAEQFKNVCAACHGPNGRSDMPGVPVLAGQPSLYTITQLFLFREGRRTDASMVALAKPMTDTDLRGYSDYIGTLPAVPPPAPATPPDAARMAKALALAQEHKCLFCHGANLEGGQQVPRIGGQKQEYLLATLKGFKSGERPGYTRAMTEALSLVPVADLDVLAYWAANFSAK
jgi:cytochrome c553